MGMIHSERVELLQATKAVSREIRTLRKHLPGRRERTALACLTALLSNEEEIMSPDMPASYAEVAFEYADAFIAEADGSEHQRLADGAALLEAVSLIRQMKAGEADPEFVEEYLAMFDEKEPA